MIVVKIELWPHGEREAKRDLGTIVIANDLSGDKASGNYCAALSHAGKYVHKPGAWKTGRVINYVRTLSPYHLVRMAIDACLSGKGEKSANGLIEYAKAGGYTAAKARLDARLVAQLRNQGSDLFDAGVPEKKSER